MYGHKKNSRINLNYQIRKLNSLKKKVKKIDLKRMVCECVSINKIWIKKK